MKKIYTTLFLSAVAIFSFAQNGRVATVTKTNTPIVTGKHAPVVQPMNTEDTLTNHWDLIGPVPVDTAVTYNSGSGYVGGQNDYGDISKAQKFDAAYGVTSGGTINSLLLWFGAKTQGVGTAMFTATVWADNAGVPGAVLGSTTFSIAQIDTAVASLNLIGTQAAIEGAYNHVATFSPRINMPANQTFWAGITFTYANGDSAGLVSSRDWKGGDAPGLTGNFLAAGTHTFDEWGGGGGWHSVNDGTTNTWQLDIAWAIYPTVSFGSTSVNENSAKALSIKNAPNPAVGNTTIYYELKEAGDVSISVVDITGKEVFVQSQGMRASGNHQMKLDVSGLTSGLYFYTVTAGGHKMTSKMNVVK